MSDIKLNELLDDEELTEIFRERAQREAERIFSATARDVMKKHAQEIAEREIEFVVDRALVGKVEMDDGWGEKQVFESLQDMFKSHLANEMKGYNLTKALESEVKKQVNALISANVKLLAAKLVAEITEGK